MVRQGIPFLALCVAGCATASVPSVPSVPVANVSTLIRADQRPTIGELSTARYCGVETKVRMLPPDPSIPENIKNAYGVWTGSMERKYDSFGSECIAAVIEEVHGDGTMNIVGFRGGYYDWGDLPRITHSVLTLVGGTLTSGPPGDQSTYVISGDTMIGTYTNPRTAHYYTLHYKRQ